MLDTIWQAIEDALGLNSESLKAGHMALRAVLTFGVTIVILRLGDKRLFGKGTTFDTVVAIMIGSVMSRSITGSSPFFPTWVAGAVLVGAHWLLATIAYHGGGGPLFKGNPVTLIKDGQIQRDGMRAGSVTKNDLEQALRQQGVPPDPSKIDTATLERDGSISVIPTKDPPNPQIFDVSVQDGVQTIRISLE